MVICRGLVITELFLPPSVLSCLVSLVMFVNAPLRGRMNPLRGRRRMAKGQLRPPGSVYPTDIKERIVLQMHR